MKIKQKTLLQIKNYFLQKPEVMVVYLFGSFARNEANKLSDIDLGIVFKEKPQKAFSLLEVQLADELAKITGFEVEIQDLALCNIDFSHRVISEGKLIYCSDEKARVEFEEKILRDFFDLKPMLDEYYYYLSLMAKKGQLGDRYIQD